MTGLRDILRRFGRDASGAALVEFAIVLPLLLLLIFAAFDFGRLFWLESAARKAADMAVRVAAVRAPLCPGVPRFHTIDPAAAVAPDGPPRYGTLCREGGICADGGVQTCTLDAASGPGAAATRDEIRGIVSALLPGIATPANLRITYTHDARLGFLGGPYTPVISAEFVDLEVSFVTPLGRLTGIASRQATGGMSDTVRFPSMYAALPAEDLGHGMGTD